MTVTPLHRRYPAGAPARPRLPLLLAALLLAAAARADDAVAGAPAALAPATAPASASATESAPAPAAPPVPLPVAEATPPLAATAAAAPAVPDAPATPATGPSPAPAPASPAPAPAGDAAPAAATMPAAPASAAGGTAAEPTCTPTPYAGLPPPALLHERPDYSSYAGLTIGAVHLARLDVFDESNRRENHLLYRLLNDAHVNTREGTVRHQLLFHSGEPLVPRIMEETGRNLRQNNYVADARVVPLQVCGDRVDLLVVTRDTWSLEPGANFSHSGGASNSGLTLKDTNLLGTGHSIAVDYTHTPERDSVDYEIDANNLFGAARINVTAHYANTSDGRKESLDVERPFFALDTHRAAGASMGRESRIDTVTSGGTVINRFGHDINTYNAFLGYSPGLVDSYNNRYTVGISREEDLFHAVDGAFPVVPEDRTLNYPWFGFERTENRFAIYNNIDFIDRTEDINLGKHMTAKLGVGARAFGNSQPQLKIGGSYSDAPEVGPHHLLRLEGHVDGGWLADAGNFENTVAGGSATYHYLAGEKSRWFARIAADAGSGLTTDHLLTIGGISDMRGYPLSFESGDRRYVVNLEHRYYSSLHLFNLVHVGNVVFADAGQAWDSRASPGISPVYDAGFGLRFTSSKAHVGRVLHMDFAVPFNDRDRIPHWQWSVKVLGTF